MQRLKVVKRLFPAVESGEKTSTIRWRELRIQPGLMIYECDTDPRKAVTVFVTSCTDMPLSQAAAFAGRKDEWPDDVMLACMREHYPEIKLTDIVQVVDPKQTRKKAAYGSL
ncbi:ASCH domain-containing protein [Mesorhizobium sp. A556]